MTIPRFITAGIQNHVPLATQHFLWEMYEEMKVDEKDYLQIFEIKTLIEQDSVKHHIVHKQGEPNYIQKHQTHAQTVLNGTIYIINDLSHLTMLWASEY